MRLALVALLAASMAGMPACTAVGAVVGAHIPKKEAIAPPVMRGAQAGEEIEVAFVDATGMHVLAGEYGGSDKDALLIESGAGTTRVPFDRIRQIRINRGDHGVEGMVAGLAVDAALVTILLVRANSMKIKVLPDRW